ncbi:MAG: tRNA (adenosine(37)-N6)-threonylcarbamoyltransferase complex ATPase subunit type 1 TsaE [Desulfobacteraceae bacterium]|jgi:tRNA threonylcarbamoyladenosine biosynthesis protein TsaE
MSQQPESRLTLFTKNADETSHLGYEIGKYLQDAVIIKLMGDLGSGKTCFVQGLAKGLDVPEGYDITSPTYTLIHEYTGRLPLVHIDLYRIHDEMDAEAIGLVEILGQEMVAAVEWADRLSHGFWPDVSTLDIMFHTIEEDTRKLQLIGYGLQTCDLIKSIGIKWERSASG